MRPDRRRDSGSNPAPKPLLPAERIRPAGREAPPDRRRDSGSNPAARPLPAGRAIPADRAIQPERAQARLAVIERRKRRQRAVSVSILVLLIMLLTVVSILIITRRGKPAPDLDFLREGVIEHRIVADGLILRDDTVINAPADGVLRLRTSPGSQVAVGQAVGSVFAADKQDTLRRVEQLRQAIVEEEIKQITAGQNAAAQAVYDSIAGSIGSLIGQVRGDAVARTLTGVGGYEAELINILEKRAARLDDLFFPEGGGDNQLMKSWRDELKSLENALGQGAGRIASPVSGVLSDRLDGLESELSLGNALKLTDMRIAELIRAQKTSADHIGASVKAGEPVLRVTTGLQQAIAFMLPGVHPDTFKLDTRVDIHLQDDRTVIRNCVVIRSELTRDGSLTVFRTDRQVAWLADRRVIKAQLIMPPSPLMQATATTSPSASSSQAPIRNLLVPRSALLNYRENDPTAVLMLIDKGYARAVIVSVVDYDASMAVVRAVPNSSPRPDIASMYVRDARSVEEGEYYGG